MSVLPRYWMLDLENICLAVTYQQFLIEVFSHSQPLQQLLKSCCTVYFVVVLSSTMVSDISCIIHQHCNSRHFSDVLIDKVCFQGGGW